MRIISEGTLRKKDETSFFFVDYVIIKSHINSNTNYVIYRMNEKEPGGYVSSKLFWSETVPKIKKEIKKEIKKSDLPIFLKSENKLDEWVFDRFNKYGRIQIEVTSPNEKNKPSYFRLELVYATLTFFRIKGRVPEKHPYNSDDIPYYYNSNNAYDPYSTPPPECFRISQEELSRHS